MFRGRVWKFGDNVDTDQMIPGKYLASHLSPGEQAIHCFENLRPEFARSVKDGDIIVAGFNFGCGSSRAGSIPIRNSGVRLIIAKSFSRIFFRTSVNIGLLPIEAPEIVDSFSDGDEIEADLEVGVIRNLRSKQVVNIPPVSPFLKEILDAGDLVEYTKTRFMPKEDGI